MSLYFIRNKKTGNIKIGYGGSVRTRLTTLQIGCDSPLEIVHEVDFGGPEMEAPIEKHLHQRFSRYRVRGEWFVPSPELLAYIDLLRSLRIRVEWIS